MRDKKPIISIFLNFLVIIASFIGIFLTLSGQDMYTDKSKALLFYTLQSNIISLIVSIVYVVFMFLVIYGTIKNIPSILLIIKFVTTCGITLTLIVFWLFLAPYAEDKLYLVSLSNLTLHTFAPMLCVIDFILFNPDFKLIFNKFYYAIFEPLYYLFFFLICSFYGVTFGPEKTDIAPYYFLNYRKYGWFKITENSLGLVYWLVLLLLLMCGIAFILIYSNKYFNKKFNKKSNIDFII